MDHPASVPVYVGAELDPSVGSIPQTPILTRSGSLSTEYQHPLADIPRDTPKDVEVGDVVKQMSTKMPFGDVPLKKRQSSRISTEGADMMTSSVTFAALPTVMSSAGMSLAGTREDSDVRLPDCRDEAGTESLSRTHTATSASTTSIHSSPDLSTPEQASIATPAFKAKQNSIRSNHGDEQADAQAEEADDEGCDEPSNIVDRMTPPVPLTPVNSLGYPQGTGPEDYRSSDAVSSLQPEVGDVEVDMDEEADEAVVEDASVPLAEPRTPDISDILRDNEEIEDEPMDATIEEASDEVEAETEKNADEEMESEAEKPSEVVNNEASTSGDDSAVLPPPPPPFDPSMRPIDVVFSFDTTG